MRLLLNAERSCIAGLCLMMAAADRIETWQLDPVYGVFARSKILGVQSKGFYIFLQTAHRVKLRTGGHICNISTIAEIKLVLTDYFDISSNMKHESLEPLNVDIAASQFAALGSEHRLSVLRTLVRAGPDGLSIGALGERCGVTGSTLTHHMKILAAAGLVTQEKQGRSIICAAAEYDVMRALSDYLLSECCADCPDGKGHNHG